MELAADIATGISCFRDTCNVYVLRSGREAVLIDAGSGAALDRLGELGVERVTDVLVTHHHRDQVEGLGRLAGAGARVWAPPYDRNLIDRVDEHWESRPIEIDYDLREDRFSLLRSVPVHGSVDEYRSRRYGAFELFTLPTPGHTPGSVTYLLEVDGRLVAFVGDLLYGDGKVWSLAATQWTYSGVEGQESTIVSAFQLAERKPDLLLPSHGGPIEDPPTALAKLRSGVGQLVALRIGGEWGLPGRLERPFEPITEHLWRNRTTFASSYVLVSETGAALGIDFGYDQATWRRPLLWSLDGLQVEAVVTTHYHDDHVAGLNLLRDVRGTEVWAPSIVAPVLEQPSRYDLPCLWPEPISVDRVMQPGEPVRWHEYELTAFPFPGHTRYAAAIAFEVDGKRVVATGDEYAFDGERAMLNYQYRNRFRRRDFVEATELLRSLRPDILISGHWLPADASAGLLDQLAADAEQLAALHDELLAEESFGEDGFGARIEPYRTTVAPHGEIDFEVTVRNPFDREENTRVALVVPPGWSVEPEDRSVDMPARAEAVVRFRVRTGAETARRARVAADLVVGSVRFGQQAEALVDVAR